jgi:DNA primase
MYIADGSVQYHCFNCGFKANYTPGRYLSNRFRKFLTWLNVSSSEIGKLSMQAMRLAQEISPESKIDQIEEISFQYQSLPKDSQKVTHQTDCIEYLSSRGFTTKDFDFYYSPTMKTRIIVPIVWQNKNIGFVARGLSPDIRPKYYAQVQPGSLFNLDAQHWSRKFVILVEGVFDAIMLDAVAILGSEISAKQKQQIDSLNRKVIIVPDRDRAGSKLIDQACDWGWSVSMPPWHDGVKDINNAVLKYGKALTIQAILKYTYDSRTKIKLNEKLWLN